jgi:gliding motility-associated-like protein
MALFAREIQAQGPNWVINPADYQYTMSVIGSGLVDCEATIDPNDMVAAFIDDSLAGFANFNTIIGVNNYVFLTVYSNVPAGENVEYKIYDASTNQVIDAKFGDVFQQNASIGSAITPFEFKTDYSLESLVVDQDTMYDYTVTGDTIAIFSLFNELMLEEVASYTFVNDATGADNISFTTLNEFLIIQEDADVLTKTSYEIHIMATSVSGCTFDESFVIIVFNTNVPPTDIVENPAYVDENDSMDVFIALLEAVDLTPIDFHTFELVGSAADWPDNAAFTINYDELLANQSYDYETQREFSLQIEVKDITGNSYIDTFTVLINDLIEAGEELKAPNYMSPNGDGVNDVFAIENVELYFNYSLYFYNDNGNLVYSNEGVYDNTWTGISNNDKELSSATYFYYFVDRSNTVDSFTGKVFIERPTKY